MNAKRQKYLPNRTIFFLIMVLLSQICSLQFFPLYLKYLNFSALEAGIIRGGQAWISALLIPVWLLLTKYLQSVTWKKFLMSTFFLISVAIYLFLAFLPGTNVFKNVTHCNENIHLPLTSIDRLLQSQYARNEHFFVTSQNQSEMHNNSVVNKILQKNYDNGTISTNITASNASLITSPWKNTSELLSPPIIYYDNVLPENDNPNSKFQSTFKLPVNISSETKSESKKLISDVTTVLNSVPFTPDILPFSDEESVPIEVTEQYSVSTSESVSPSLLPSVNSKESNREQDEHFSSVKNEIKSVQSSNYKQHNYFDKHGNQKLVLVPTVNEFQNIAHLEKEKNAGNSELQSYTATPQQEIESLDSNMKTLFSLLNKTLSNVHSHQLISQSNKNILDQKSEIRISNSNENTNNVNSVSMEPEIYNAESTVDQNKELNSLTNTKNYIKGSDVSDIHDQEIFITKPNQKPNHLIFESEGDDTKFVPNRNNYVNTVYHQSWHPKQTITPQVEYKYPIKYYSQQDSPFDSISHKESDMSSEDDNNFKLFKKPNTEIDSENLINSSLEMKNANNTSNTTSKSDDELREKYTLLKTLLNQYLSERASSQATQKSNPTLHSNGVKNTWKVKKVQSVTNNIKSSDKPVKNLQIKGHGLRKIRSTAEELVRSIPVDQQLRKNKFTKLYKAIKTKHSPKSTSPNYINNNKFKRFLNVSQPSSKANTGNSHEKFEEKNITMTQLRRLMKADITESQNYNNSLDSEPHKLLMSWLKDQDISKHVWNLILESQLPHIFSTTFAIMLLLAILCEVSASACVSSCSKIMNCDAADRISVKKSVTISHDHYQVWSLLSWAFIGCPVLTTLVLVTDCTYQPRVFLLLSTIFIMLALFMILLLVKLPETQWDWKLQDYPEKWKYQNTSLFLRFGHCLSTFVTSFAMACNSEFILWYIETLNGFPYNYQVLYCSYVAIGSLSQAIVRSWLQKKQIVLHVEDCSTSGTHDVDVPTGDGLWSISPILLGLHFLAASSLKTAWSLVFLGVLQGSSSALVSSITSSGWWTLGYGLGCLIGGHVVHTDGADWLFWIMAGSMFVWSAIVTLFGRVLRCVGNNDNDRAAYSQLLLPECDSENEEDVEVCEEVYESEDWLEKALQTAEKEEDIQRRRIMSCPT